MRASPPRHPALLSIAAALQPSTRARPRNTSLTVTVAPLLSLHRAQASYYYMGHFSRYLPPGSRRVGMVNDVVPGMGELGAKDIMSGSPLVFQPCLGNELQARRDPRTRHAHAHART